MLMISDKTSLFLGKRVNYDWYDPVDHQSVAWIWIKFFFVAHRIGKLKDSIAQPKGLSLTRPMRSSDRR